MFSDTSVGIAGVLGGSVRIGGGVIVILLITGVASDGVGEGDEPHPLSIGINRLIKKIAVILYVFINLRSNQNGLVSR